VSAAAIALGILAFGDADGTVWGATWISGPAGAAESLVMLGRGSGRASVGTLRLSGGPGPENAQWRIGDDPRGLVVSAVGQAVPVHDAESKLEGYYQLCRVTGHWASDGADGDVDCLGVQVWFAEGVELARYESIRAVSSWFEPDQGLTLTALRSRKAKAHDGDAVAGAVIGPDSAEPAEDPRLSTTYAADGWPVRAGLELWLAAEKSGERHYSRRASGEATGARAQGAVGDYDIRAEPFRWHSRGRDGAGMYVLARRR
jgi:hypothetical protein